MIIIVTAPQSAQLVGLVFFELETMRNIGQFNSSDRVCGTRHVPWAGLGTFLLHSSSQWATG